jgi:hypothetical protein
MLRALAHFPVLRHLEINSPRNQYSSKIDERSVEGIFNFLAAEKDYRKTLREHLNWLPLEVLDIKAGEWEPALSARLQMVLEKGGNYILRCQQVGGTVEEREFKMTTIGIADLNYDEDDWYGRALASAGFHDRSKVL